MKRLFKLFVWTALLSVLGMPSLMAQDLSKEIQNSWGDLKGSLEKLQLERNILTRVESKLTDQYERLLLENAEIEQEIALKEGVPESLSTLLQNCLIELQKIRWDEATEKAVIEELSVESESTTPTASDIASLNLKGRLDVMVADLDRKKEYHARIMQLHEKGNVSKEVIEESATKLQKMMIEIDAIQRELEVQQAIAKADKKQPVLETTRRLAKNVARRKLLEEEASEIRKAYQAVKEVRQKELKASLIQKRAELVQEQLIPIQSRKLQVEAIIEYYEQLLAK